QALGDAVPEADRRRGDRRVVHRLVRRARRVGRPRHAQGPGRGVQVPRHPPEGEEVKTAGGRWTAAGPRARVPGPGDAGAGPPAPAPAWSWLVVPFAAVLLALPI